MTAHNLRQVVSHVEVLGPTQCITEAKAKRSFVSGGFSSDPNIFIANIIKILTFHQHTGKFTYNLSSKNSQNVTDFCPKNRKCRPKKHKNKYFILSLNWKTEDLFHLA